MRITLGIDPGTRITGYGLIREDHDRLECLSFGTFEGRSKDAMPHRLLSIGHGLRQVLAEFKPHAVAIEKTFFAKNVDSATKLGHARGVCLYECAQAGLPIFEYNPTEVKLGITGSGRAEKDQVQFVVAKILSLSSITFEKFDMSDALALAVYHSRLDRTKSQLEEREIVP